MRCQHQKKALSSLLLYSCPSQFRQLEGHQMKQQGHTLPKKHVMVFTRSEVPELLLQKPHFLQDTSLLPAPCMVRGTNTHQLIFG